MDPEFCALIKRHVVQADAHNRYLEKKRMWREYEEELAREGKKQDNQEEAHDADRNGSLRLLGDGDTEQSLRLRRNYRDRARSQGILAGENAEHSDASEGRICRSDTGSERGRRMHRRSVVPSFDVHAADRVVTASEKQRRLLRSATAAVGDTWLPDKFYTHELQQEHPWVNPTEALSRYIASKKSSDEELTPKASTSAESSDDDAKSGSCSKDTRRKLKKKKRGSRAKKKRKKKRKAAKVREN